MNVLSTKRLHLHVLTPSDLPELAALHFDKQVMRYRVGGARTSLLQVQHDLDTYLMHQHKHNFSKWAVLHNEDGTWMGTAGFMHIDSTNEIDLGFAFHVREWVERVG